MILCTFLLALALIALPFIAPFIMSRTGGVGRHHDHLIPGTPRSFRAAR